MFLFSSGVILFTVSTFPNSFVEYVVCLPVLFVPYSTFAVVTLSSLLFVKFVIFPSIVSIFVSIPCIVVSTSFLLFVIVSFIVSSCVVKFSVVTLSSLSVFSSLIAFDIVLLVNPLSFVSKCTFSEFTEICISVLSSCPVINISLSSAIIFLSINVSCP